jgi:hypothetical protein
MKRDEKLYAALDALVEEFQGLLIKEYGKGEAREVSSKYLHKKLDDRGRSDHIHVQSGGFEEANTLLSLEKRIRQICLKMDEPLPLPIVVIEEYVDAYWAMKKQTGQDPWKVDGEHKRIKKQMLVKLSEGK